MLACYGRAVEVKPDAYVVPDGWRGFGGRLREAGDGFSTYRLPVNSMGTIKTLAVEVKITGRDIQSRGGNWWIRVRITFVGDGEPDTTSGGWMKID